MTRALPVVLVLALLVVAGVAPALPAAGTGDDPAPERPSLSPQPVGDAPAGPATPLETPVVTEPNTSNYLGPPAGAITASGVTTSRIDVGAAVTADAARLAVRFRTGNVLGAYRAAGDDDERRAVVTRYFRRIENATTALERRERAALAAYNDGEYSAGDYLRELARIDATADRLRTTLGQVERLAHPEHPVAKADLGAVRVRLRLLQGPVRGRVGAALAGTADPVRVQVETTGSAVVLAAVVQEGSGGVDAPTHLREAYLPERHDRDAINRYADRESVLARLDGLYPWVAEESTGFSFDFGPPPAATVDATNTYSASYQHLHGRLTVLFDGGTDRVFRETQRLDLRLVPRGPSVTNSSDGLTVVVERLRASGPVRVTVVDETGNATDPADATVRVAGTRVGRTGDDGTLWTVAPRGSVTVTASAGNRNVTVTRFAVSTDAPNRTALAGRRSEPS